MCHASRTNSTFRQDRITCSLIQLTSPAKSSTKGSNSHITRAVSRVAGSNVTSGKSALSGPGGKRLAVYADGSVDSGFDW